jgi:hypothetical protein
MFAIALLSAPAAAVEVGIAVVDIEPPIGIPLAGYGAKARRLPGYLDWGNKLEHAALFRPSVGRHSAINSKAMVIRDGDSKVVFVSVDLVGVEKRLVEDLASGLAHLDVAVEELVVAATHTHSGPGTISHRPTMALIAADRFRRENYDLILAKVVQSVELAFERLQVAELVATEFETKGLQRNKWRRIGEGHFDSQARFLLAVSSTTHQIMGGLLNYALHGNGMPIDDLRFSSDTPGSIATNMERLIAEKNGPDSDHPVVLFMNGAEGDVGNRERSVAAVEADGRAFAEQARAAGALDSLRPVGSSLRTARKKVWLGMPGVSLRNCTGPNDDDENTGIDFRLPMPLMQQRTFVSFISVGDIHMLTWPGEPSVQVGYDTQAIATENGFPNSWILGLANDYQSYFTVKTEYNLGAYDSCNSLFRWKGALRIQSAMSELMIGRSDENTAN